MTTQLSKAFLRKDSMSRDEKFQTMQLRRAHLTEICKKALRSSGYVLGTSLKVPGGHAFNATYNGKSLKVGIKSSADRWVGATKDKDGGFGVLSKVDEVFVVTFDNWREPTKVQVYKFKPQTIVKIAEKAYAEAKEKGQTGLKWFPLDHNDGQRPSTTQHNAHLVRYGELVFDEPIVWGDVAETSALTPADGVSPIKADGIPIMERIKTMLSEHMGVRPEFIEVDVRVKI